MSVIQYINAFNKYLDDFVSGVIELFPEDKDFRLAKSSLIMLKTFDERYPVAFFKIYIKEYEKYIEEQNADFFLKKDYSDEVKVLNGEQQKEVFNIITKLKNYWAQLDKVNQTKIWKFLQGLLKLSQKVPYDQSLKLPDPTQFR
jgi:hypothetical protein